MPGTYCKVSDGEMREVLRQQFCLDWSGAHGVEHWLRVRENGMRIARATGADVLVVEAFAFLHDVCRESEGSDPDHGKRAAEFAGKIRQEFLRLDDAAFAVLIEACAYHNTQNPPANMTVATCWDADRLDLGRVGIKPDPRLLCTPYARERSVIDRAYAASREARRRSRGKRGKRGRG